MNATDKMLSELLDAARKNHVLKQELLQTRTAKDPMDAFCFCAQRNGFPITVGELFEAGEQFTDDIFCSCNGRAEEPIAEWSDAYESFLAALENSCASEGESGETE
ncbi:MAG: hypothetical protein LKF71_06695 [Oscillospiraceae bacterium]|jgi:phage tail sheath gpL-like|nr:hypothetical protein [Oscillospiraceae bacterium]